MALRAAQQRSKPEKERAEREKAEAIEAEKARQAEEAMRREAEKQKREANLKHRHKIIGEVVDDLVAADIVDIKDAQSIVECILDGEIRHTKIEF